MFNMKSCDLGLSNREAECDHRTQIPLPLVYFLFTDNAYHLHSSPFLFFPLLPVDGHGLQQHITSPMHINYCSSFCYQVKRE